MQCGLLPSQVLDMNLPMFQACVEGYQDHLFDLKCIAITQGFWAGYYGNSKRPKPLSSILTSLEREHQKSKKRRGTKKLDVTKPSMEVEVDTFLARERKRLRTKPKN